MHRIYKEKDLTLLGPVDPSKTLIHPSLSFYMLMPFAILGDFSPQSPAYGTAFFGVLTAVVFLVLAKDKKLLGYAVLLAIFWAPLVLMSRWAWNPHLVPFVQGLALIIFSQKFKGKDIVAGLIFGLTFHLHFFAFVSFFGFWLVLFARDILKKKYNDSFQLGLGFALTVTPFVIFDIKNPPGLFFGRFLQNNLIKSGVMSQNTSAAFEFLGNVFKTLEHLAGSGSMAIVLGIVFALLIYSDFRTKIIGPFLYLAPVLFQIFFINYLPAYEARYFYLALAFFWVWLFYPRQETSIPKMAVVVMLVVSLFQLKTILSVSPLPPGGYVADRIAQYVGEKIKKDDIKNANIAVLASADKDAFGQIYRHTLDMEGITLRLENQYDITDNLFVVTTSPESVVRGDAANLINDFREGPLVDTYQIEKTDWKVFLFNRY